MVMGFLLIFNKDLILS